MKKIVFIDMDSVIADFEASEAFDPYHPIKNQVYKMYEPGFFFKLKPVPGALAAVRAIMRMDYDVHILSRLVAESPHSYTEKAQWIALWFPELINNVHFTQDKGLFKGDYLIDDDDEKWKIKFEANGGKFIHFEYQINGDNSAVWRKIVHFFELAKENI